MRAATVFLAAVLLLPSLASAQDDTVTPEGDRPAPTEPPPAAPPTEPPPAAPPPAAPVPSDEGADELDDDELDDEGAVPVVPAGSPVTFGGYVETYWSYNFGEPSNGITNLRGFDNWHNSITLANIVVDLAWDIEGVFGRVALQYGSTGASYYLGEPVLPGAGVSAGTGFELWRYAQEARLGYRMPFLPELAVEAGLFLSPIGPRVARGARVVELLAREHLRGPALLSRGHPHLVRPR